jgi:hypothetical protein
VVHVFFLRFDSGVPDLAFLHLVYIDHIIPGRCAMRAGARAARARPAAGPATACRRFMGLTPMMAPSAVLVAIPLISALAGASADRVHKPCWELDEVPWLEELQQAAVRLT